MDNRTEWVVYEYTETTTFKLSNGQLVDIRPGDHILLDNESMDDEGYRRIIAYRRRMLH